MKILIDTHILVRREHDRVIDRHLQDVMRLASELNYQFVIHPLSVAEVEKDKNIPNRSTLVSKLRTYPVLNPQSHPNDDKGFSAIIQKPKSEREQADNYLLYCLYKNEVDLFLTEDVEIIEKAEKLNIANRVMILQEASSFFKKALQEKVFTGEDIPEFCFYKKGKRWIIGEKGNTREFDHLDGFGCIQYLLRHENQFLPSLLIHTGGQISGDKQSDEKNIKIAKFELNPDTTMPLYEDQGVRKNKQYLKLKIGKLQNELDSNGSLSPLDIVEKKQEVEALKKELNKRPERDTKSPSGRARVSVSKLIKLALLTIHNEEAIASIRKYLNKETINKGISCIYRPIEGDKPTWILFPE